MSDGIAWYNSSDPLSDEDTAQRRGTSTTKQNVRRRRLKMTCEGRTHRTLARGTTSDRLVITDSSLLILFSRARFEAIETQCRRDTWKSVPGTGSSPPRILDEDRRTGRPAGTDRGQASGSRSGDRRWS